MNALATPTALPGAPALPAPQAGAGRDRADEPFSRCLDRAVDRDAGSPPAHAGRPPAERVRARDRDDAATTPDDGAAAPARARPDDDRPEAGTASDAAEESEAQRGARARGPRRVGHGDPRADAIRPVKDPQPAMSPMALTAGGAADPTADATTEAKSTNEAEPRGIDTLLPGWPALPRESAAASTATPAAVAASAAATGAAALASEAALAPDVAARTDVAPTPVDAAGMPAMSGADGEARSAARRTATAAAPVPSSATTTLQDGAASTPAFAQALQGAADDAAAGRTSALARPASDGPALPAWSAAAASAASAAAPAPATSEPTRIAQSHVAAPLDSPAFAPALATQVRWLVREGMQEARLSLNPAEMGPVSVQIVIDGRDARIDFRADLAATRQALEASLPVLAAALDDSGLRLAGGGVHDGAGPRQGDPGATPGSPWRARVSAEEPAPAALSAAATRGSGRERGLVDLVA